MLLAGLVVASGALVSAPAAAQQPEDSDAAVVRIVARKGADGRVEFALQQRHDDTWGQRQLPRSRFFPTTAPVDRWLTSSPLNLDDRPATTPTTKRYTAITAGYQLSCALDSDGTITCSGDNDIWQATPPTGGGYTAISTGGDESYLQAPVQGHTGFSHSCALDSDGAITCWGGSRTFCTWAADSGLTCSQQETNAGTGAPTGRGYTAIAAGSDHSCALDRDGAITCWGANDSDSAVTDAPTGRGYTAIAASPNHSCALYRDGAITCWGQDHPIVTDAPTGRGYTAISACAYHSCALDRDGAITCSGDRSFPPAG